MLSLAVSTGLAPWLAVSPLALATGFLAYALLGSARPQRQVVANLQRGLVQAPTAESHREQHGASALQRFAARLTPAAQVRRLERLYQKAGHPAGWPVSRLLVAKLVLPAVSLALGLMYVSSVPKPLSFLVVGITVLVCAFLPELLLHSRGQERSQRISLELADTLDQVMIAVEAGLGFDAAMSRVARAGRGPLAEELVRTLQEIQVGKSRRQAYEALAARVDVLELRRFVRAILQAESYGVAVADVLRTQAAEMRLKRRQRAEEKAMKIPVKVIFPLMFCILPVLFIVLLGPAAMNMLGAFR